MTGHERTWIGRGDAERLLGVKSQTLYAYVSRGHITARPDPENPRRSLYDARDVQRLADRSGVRAAPSAGRGARHEILIESALTQVGEDTLTYRGEDAIALSEHATLEQTARLFWGGVEDPFAEQRPRIDVLFPGGPRARAFACLSRRADEDGASSGRSPASLRREAASLVNELVDSIAGPGPRLHLHQRLARAWKAPEQGAHLIRRALVLACDHEADAATLAVRVAAGAGASLSACALAGLAALSGPELGGRLAQVTGFVLEARKADARTAARNRLSQGLDLPGFGLEAHPEGDPRARALIEAAGLPAPLADIARVGESLTGRAPCFDLALALVAQRLDLPREAPFALLTIGRTVGWLGHAMEQAVSGSPPRARLRYVGPGPAGGAA
ncbi:citrate/2-methylcitrate synthase [Brevundimonas sp.]|uniref:citrate/2-methylcitrate synthase n=1 Tax=Brevundimonas sp. TaxID=1871086 RepID=UPI0025D8B936|nr:citrate/2-methylcitrate synthase [Brevundimonas sp.]